jgi:hypothetical protein
MLSLSAQYGLFTCSRLPSSVCSHPTNTNDRPLYLMTFKATSTSCATFPVLSDRQFWACSLRSRLSRVGFPVSTWPLASLRCFVLNNSIPVRSDTFVTCYSVPHSHQDNKDAVIRRPSLLPTMRAYGYYLIGMLVLPLCLLQETWPRLKMPKSPSLIHTAGRKGIRRSIAQKSLPQRLLLLR